MGRSRREQVGDERGGDEADGQLEDGRQVEPVKDDVDQVGAIPDQDDVAHAPQPIRLGQRILFVGNTGKGKTEGLLALFAAHRGQRLLIDVQDYLELGPAALAEDPPPLDGISDPREIDWRHRTIRYVPKRPGDRREMDRLHAAIYRRGRLLVACDEAEDVAPSQGGGSPFHVRKCVKQGRKYLITYAAATQRPVGVDRAVINQSEHAFIFPMVDGDDLKVISYRLGMGPDELARTLAQLGPYEYLRHTIGDDHVIAMPALPAEAIEQTRQHVRNPQFTRR